MKTKEEIEDELKILDKTRENLKNKFDMFNKDLNNVNSDDFVDAILNGLTTIVKYYTLCWVIEKSDNEKLQLLQKKIKKEYIEPLSMLIKEQLKK
ncbi:hypothetical protein HYU09_02595 [Candidatus Woesearchaeota archaeon]|nr:hypothetical protein [Candidatus Woesearchaeota archaeon]